MQPNIFKNPLWFGVMFRHIPVSFGQFPLRRLVFFAVTSLGKDERYQYINIRKCNSSAWCKKDIGDGQVKSEFFTISPLTSLKRW